MTSDLEQVVERLEERIGESFDGECHLTEAEARETAALLRSQAETIASLKARIESAPASVEASALGSSRNREDGTGEPSKGGSTCGARNAYPEPMDCDWPHCHCDERAGKVLEALIEEGWGPPGVEAADARRYRYLRDHCSSHYPMTWEQPAEWSIGWEFQQVTPAQACGSFDKWIDEDIARQAASDIEDDTAEHDASVLSVTGRSKREGEAVANPNPSRVKPRRRG